MSVTDAMAVRAQHHTFVELRSPPCSREEPQLVPRELLGGWVQVMEVVHVGRVDAPTVSARHAEPFNLLGLNAPPPRDALGVEARLTPRLYLLACSVEAGQRE